DVVGERMLECVGETGEQLCLIKKLRHLEMSKATPELFFLELHNRLKQQKRHIHADDRSRLQQPLVLGGKPVNAGGENSLGRCGDLQRLWRLHETISTAHAGERFRFDQCPDALLEEEGVALGPLYQELLEGPQSGVIPEQSHQQLVGVLGWQGIDPELAIVGLIAPGVAMLGAVVDEEQEARRWQAVDEMV